MHGLLAFRGPSDTAAPAFRGTIPPTADLLYVVNFIVINADLTDRGAIHVSVNTRLTSLFPANLQSIRSHAQ